ncbi:MAG: DedA family protein [Paludibacteraceae bacterium]|nr:DedA family protein [Paludibacteraceae bacterium]
MTLVSDIIAWYSAHMSYAAVVALMAVESSFIPFPSEIVVPPAAYVACLEGSQLATTGVAWIDVLLVILAGTLGALLGAMLNYGLSVWLGRPLIYKFADSRLGHMCLLSSEKLKQAEDYFNDHGNASTFFGRLVPAVRQLISIPAGLSRMPFGAFVGYTTLGALLWNTVLALLGWVAQGNADLINKYSHELSVAILVLVGAVVLYFVAKRLIAGAKRK